MNILSINNLLNLSLYLLSASILIFVSAVVYKNFYWYRQINKRKNIESTKKKLHYIGRFCVALFSLALTLLAVGYYVQKYYLFDLFSPFLFIIGLYIFFWNLSYKSKIILDQSDLSRTYLRGEDLNMVEKESNDFNVDNNLSKELFDLPKESLHTLMKISWQEHQKTREQTWKALQIEVALAAGLITVKSNFTNNKWAIIIAGLLPIFLGFFGIQVTRHHRKYQQKKFKIIQDCENLLGLKKIVDRAIKKIDEPSQRGNKNNRLGEVSEIKLLSIINPVSKPSTPLFIMRMHLAIIIFSLVIIVFSII